MPAGWAVNRWTEADRVQHLKTDRLKVALARKRRRESVMSLRWIAQRLHMGSGSTLKQALHNANSLVTPFQVAKTSGSFFPVLLDLGIALGVSGVGRQFPPSVTSQQTPDYRAGHLCVPTSGPARPGLAKALRCFRPWLVRPKAAKIPAPPPSS